MVLYIGKGPGLNPDDVILRPIFLRSFVLRGTVPGPACFTKKSTTSCNERIGLCYKEFRHLGFYLKFLAHLTCVMTLVYLMKFMSDSQMSCGHILMHFASKN